MIDNFNLVGGGAVCLRYERTEEAKKVRKQYEAHELTHGFHELSEMQPRQDGKTNTLSTVLKDNPIAEPVNTATWGGARQVPDNKSAVSTDESKEHLLLHINLWSNWNC